MSHDTDPKPLPDPKEKAPNAPAGEPHPPEQPELDGLDPSPTHAGDGPDDELTFELPPPGASPSSFTMRVPIAEMADIPGLPDVPPSDPPSGIPPVPVSELTPLVEDPLVEPDDLVPIADTAPGADPSSSTTLATKLDPPSGVNLTADSGTRLKDLAAHLPPEASEDAVGTQEYVPAEQAGADSGVINILEPLAPVLPASGWFDVPAEAAEEPASGEPVADAEPASAVGEATPVQEADGSDIFGGPPTPATAELADVSDVIVATAYSSTGTTPADGLAAGPSVPSEPPDRPSDIALTFDAPPGGSTMKDAMASAGLPVADEVPAEEPLLPAAEGEGLFDSARLASAPELPDRQIELSAEDADVGASPAPLADASNILAELADPTDRPAHDSSAVRIEAPGIERTISDEPLPEGALEADLDLTAADEPMPTEPRERPADQGSIFDVPSADEIDIGVHPFEEVPTAEQAPVSAAGQSSIFSPPKAEGGTGTGTAEVPLSNPDPTDAVDFSDHPDPAGADSGTFHKDIEPLRPQDIKRPAKPAKPAAEDDEGVDWSVQSATPGAGDSGILSGPSSGVISRGRRPPPDEEIAALLSDLSGETTPLPPAPAKPTKAGQAKPPSTPAPTDGSDPSVVVDWVAGSSEETPVPDTRARPTRPREQDGSADPTRLASLPAARPRSGLDRLLGVAIGLVVGAGVFAALYFSGVIPNESKSAANRTPNTAVGQQPDNGTPQPGGPGLAAGERLRFDPEGAARDLAGASTPQAKADLGKAQLLLTIRQGGDPKAARENLEAVANDPEAAKTPEGEKAAVQATLDLATSYQLAGDWKKARAICLDGIKKFPNSKSAFETALDRINALEPGDGKTSRLTPADAEQLVLASAFLVGNAGSPPRPENNASTPEPPEAGAAFWKAVNLAAAGKYDEATQKIDEAKKAHQERARALAGQGLNPATDPLEQIFPRCCDDLKAYWELKKTVYGNPTIAAMAKKDGLAKALADAEKKAADSAKLAAELQTEKEKLANVEKELKAEKDTVAKLEKELKAEKDSVTKLEKELKAEKDSVTKLEKDLKTEKEDAVKLEKVLKAEKDTTTNLKTDLKKAQDDATNLKADLKKANDALAVAEKGRSDAQATLDAIAKELQAAKILPAKYDNAGLLAAAKGAAKLASSPELAGAVERAVKAEAEAKAAKDELTKATTKFEADVKKLKDGHAAETKKLADGYAADIKKLKDEHAAELKTASGGIDKLKEAHALELKKLGEKYLADKKKLDDDHAAAIKKLKDEQAVELKKQADENARQLKALEQAVADEKAKLVLMAKKFEADLGNAVSPAQTLDLWLTILTGLRRPEDSAPAIEAAKKVLAIAPAGTEDVAKAQTVYGMALLVKGDPVGAKGWFVQARSSPAYREAAGKKDWAKATDLGLASLDDPLAPLRRPAEAQRKDSVQAAKALDAGITAYRAGRYPDAVNALTQAAWHDDTNPLTWYFLGAARWQMGNTEEARNNFAQGGMRERGRTVPVRMIDLAIGPIQGPARDALAAARP